MRATLLLLLATAAASAQTDGRLTVSGVYTGHAVIGANAGTISPGVTAAVAYRTSPGDRLGAFAFLSPETPYASRVVAVGGTWDVLLTRSVAGPYLTLGVAGMRQAESEDSPCSIDDGCFRDSFVDRSAFTTAAVILGGGSRFSLGRRAFVQVDARVLNVGTDLYRARPLLSLGGGVRL